MIMGMMMGHFNSPGRSPRTNENEPSGARVMCYSECDKFFNGLNLYVFRYRFLHASPVTVNTY